METPMKRYARIAWIAIAIVAALAAPVSAVEGNTAEQVLELINAERAKEHLPPVKLNSKLTEAARDFADYLKTHHAFSHTADGRSPGARIKAAGYHWSAEGEIILKGASTAAGAVRGWMNSPGHRAIILGKSYQEIGVGRSGAYWVVDFGRPR